MEKDFAGTLHKVKALGYDGVEFAGLFGHTAQEIKALCAEVGVTPVSAHVPFADMMSDPDLLKVYAEIGCKFVAIPYLTEEYRPGQPKFGEVIEGAKMLGKKAKELGMQLCYHNHDFEFVKIDGEYALDVLYREVPADLLETKIVHLKDFAGQKSEHMYALIGIDDDKKAEPVNTFEFRPVGYGKQDMPSILAAAKDAGAEWVVVEQDQPSLGKTPMQCAEMSINYLKTLID